MRKKIFAAFLMATILSTPYTAEGGLLFHATKRSIAQKMAKKGFSINHMSDKARFGKGAYLAKSKATAIKEKPNADAVVVFKETKTLKDHIINVKNMKKGGLKSLSGDGDLRGNIHKGIIGPDLGKKIARRLAPAGKSILYQSAKDRHGSNVVIPAAVYKKNPRIVNATGDIHYVK